jgi:hypothetical protein
MRVLNYLACSITVTEIGYENYSIFSVRVFGYKLVKKELCHI